MQCKVVVSEEMTSRHFAAGCDRNRWSTTVRVKDRISQRLSIALTPTFLEVFDESHQHAGHAGWRQGGETHFRVHIVAATFVGKSRIDRHRLIHAALAEELQAGVHALAIVAKAPGE
jgi:BolA family transcriptional regulator, general stress-responsive regulator